ncbi:tumor necrosis factor receptor superfamily member 14 isoform X1 [Artibeus jamaicensis]|uniref:tumor necrosis factor receptor superfamily member 14 isoform X1 n=1 Tax=Artibeus jamaicensis TaxID=9417 RepID=UPI00235A6BCE|nr:tumor necrosis factor receptor superfamily member 14 isoform X1 [Artibeus jamaicensis]XP_037002881.2 tumor necrosis factor receptor superfamily member 14 isoform X1 [Artibeus jamaicensis]XP_037002882.2 tumor necrosis factor receptor superfamily member 14 isoform X1 [Artibeus jamaicensis]XP_037002883.2 tumor necrosis factor receptor superfamily member 14 isoform X1 [Artibeus jamaicensis]XP_053516607.1 tumor necrosis factor receptor superfamily member 14 isoform X1 [Artibeus jamaicensis]
MEPLQAWEPPRWSLEPTVDALSLTLVLVFLGCPPCARAMTSCKLDEYPVGDYCCPKCRPGYRVKEACRGSRTTLCAACTEGTFTAHLNGLNECLQCRVCDPDMGLVIRQKCSSTANTLCGCARGHFCVSDADQCAECRPHSVCKPGQRVQEAGTEHRDTVCEDCPPGTFSPNGTLAACLPWTQCSQAFQMQAKPGTNSTDATCSSLVPWLLLVSILFILFGAGVFVFVRKRPCGGSAHKRCLSQGNRQQAEGRAAAVQIQGVTQILPDVTTVAVEETASMFPKGDPSDHQWLQGAAT